MLLHLAWHCLLYGSCPSSQKERFPITCCRNLVHRILQRLKLVYSKIPSVGLIVRTSGWSVLRLHPMFGIPEEVMFSVHPPYSPKCDLHDSDKFIPCQVYWVANLRYIQDGRSCDLTKDVTLLALAPLVYYRCKECLGHKDGQHGPVITEFCHGFCSQ